MCENCLPLSSHFNWRPLKLLGYHLLPAVGVLCKLATAQPPASCPDIYVYMYSSNSDHISDPRNCLSIKCAPLHSPSTTAFRAGLLPWKEANLCPNKQIFLAMQRNFLTFEWMRPGGRRNSALPNDPGLPSHLLLASPRSPLSTTHLSLPLTLLWLLPLPASPVFSLASIWRPSIVAWCHPTKFWSWPDWEQRNRDVQGGTIPTGQLTYLGAFNKNFTRHFLRGMLCVQNMAGHILWGNQIITGIFIYNSSFHQASNGKHIFKQWLLSLPFSTTHNEQNI